MRHTEIAAKWKRRNRHKDNAHQVVQRAVRTGKIKRPSRCSRCRRKSQVIHGHHRDYSKPLEVVWLCAKCHKLEHRMNTN